MLVLVRILLSLALIGDCASCLFPSLHNILPLGGNALTQLGVILAVSVLATEIYIMTRKRPSSES